MAKDGTNRGGKRAGAGRKPKALSEKIVKGKSAEIIQFPCISKIDDENIPEIKEYLKASQKDGKDLCAEEIFKSVYQWLKDLGCEKLVNIQLIEQYSMSVSRWIQCETYISEFGLLGNHPTTGAPIISPYVSMSQQYVKQANQCWFQIFQVVKENCSGNYSSSNSNSDLMETLLSARK